MDNTSKPPFDPSQPYEPAYKPAFDPNLPFQKGEASPYTGMLPESVEAALHGIGQGATLNKMPQLVGGLAHPVGAVKELLGTDASDPDVQAYEQTRDQASAGSQQVQQEHPVASTVGQIGGFATGPGKAIGVVSAAAGPLAGIAASSAAGGIADPNTKRGLALGAIGGAASEAANAVLPSVADAISNRLRGTAIAAAIRHLRPTPLVARQLGPEALSGVGEEALQSGAIEPFAKASTTAANMSDLLDEVGELKSDLVNQSPATIEPHDLAQRVQSNVLQPLQQTTAGKVTAAPIQGKLDALLEDLGESPVPVSRIENEKMAEQGLINWKTDPTAKIAAQQGYQSQLRQAVEDAVNNPQFNAAKQSYGNLKEGAGMAARTAGLTDSGTGLMGHIGDTAAMMEGIQGLASANPFQALTPVARALTKGRVASTLATGAWGASKALANNPNALNPVAQAITARTTYLQQQTDPRTQQQLKDQQ